MSLTPAQVQRYVRKAAVVVDAWRALFGVEPSRNALVLVMAVAEGETRLGDVRGWEGENNWGALHKRMLTAQELAILSAYGITAALGAEGERRARELLSPGANERLHLDTGPHGPYFVWFWSFPTEVEGAKKFVGTLVAARPHVRAILDIASPELLARAMYESRYYEGTHKGDPEANIADYATLIRSRADVISHALVAMVAALPASFAVPSLPSLPPIDAGGWASGWGKNPYDAGGSVSDWSAPAQPPAKSHADGNAPAQPPATQPDPPSGFAPIAFLLGIGAVGVVLVRMSKGPR